MALDNQECLDWPETLAAWQFGLALGRGICEYKSCRPWLPESWFITDCHEYCFACKHEPFTFLPDNVCAVENSCRFEHAHEAQRVADMGQQHTELDTSIPLPIASLSENLSGSQSVYCVCHSNSVSNL